MLVLHQVRVSSCYPFQAPLNLSFGSRRTYGLLGVNGAGKTTLLRILMGDISPESGEVRGQMRCAYVAQENTWPPDLTLGAFIETTPSMSFGASGALWRDRLGLDSANSELHLASLSGGEKTLWALWKAIMQEPEMLLLDEPSNHLDQNSCDCVIATMQTLPCIFVVSSHDPRILMHMEELIDLTQKGVRIYGDGYERYLHEVMLERMARERELVDAKKSRAKTVAKAHEAIQRQERRQRKGRKHALSTGIGKMKRGMMQRSGENTAGKIRGAHDAKMLVTEQELQVARSQVEEKEVIRLHWSGPSKYHGRLLAVLRDVNYRFEGGKNLWFKPLQLDVVGGEKILVRGRIGAGKSTLLHLLKGTIEPTEGEIVRRSERVAILQQDPRLCERATENILQIFQRRHASRSLGEIRAWLARFLFVNDDQLKEWRVLSGGEKMRCGLADAFLSDPDLEWLLLDEPTNHLDQRQIEPLLLFLNVLPIAVIVVTHDQRLMEQVRFDRVIDL